MKETSKLFRSLGAQKKSQRGIVARKTLARLERFELAEFEKSLPKIELKQAVPIKYGGRVIGYL